MDLACGSAPLLPGREREEWVGVDRSPSELARATKRGPSPLLCADATALPFAPGVFKAVACSMAIMLLQPLDDVLSEIRRVLPRGGTAVFILPGSWPLGPRDLLRYGRLMAAIRRSHLAYPNDRRLVRLIHLGRRAGFELVADERRRFAYPIHDKASAQQFVDSLYLPSFPKSHVAEASKVAARWVGGEIGIPLRRVILQAS